MLHVIAVVGVEEVDANGVVPVAQLWCHTWSGDLRPNVGIADLTPQTSGSFENSAVAPCQPQMAYEVSGLWVAQVLV